MQQRSDVGSFSFKQKQQQQQQPVGTFLHSSSSVGADDLLFQTPSDLVCPITLSLFQDPVCNALGQVYERAALQRHLLQAAVSGQPATDPVSNAVLPSLDLVPVWPMRSRAAEYRDSTIRACVQSASAPDCADPVKYLRRAAELVLSTDPAGKGSLSRLSSSSSSASLTPTASLSAAASPGVSGRASVSSAQPAGEPGAVAAAQAADGPTTSKGEARSPPGAVTAAGPEEVAGSCVSSTGVPGLTVEFAQYLAAHRGSQYDALVLKYFGNELLRAGCPDAASNVFYRLLLGAEDKVQQAEYLQLCLDCWTVLDSPSSSEPSRADSTDSSCVAGDGSSKQDLKQGKGQAAAGPASTTIVNKLADFVQRQRCLSPRAIVQMLESTHHGSAMAMQLCQVLLARAAAAAAAAPVGNAEAALGLPGGLGGVLEVMLELVDLGHGQLLEQLQQLTQQVQQLQVQQRQDSPAGDTVGSTACGQDVKAGLAVQQAAADSSEAAGAAVKKHSRKCRGHAWRGGKGVDVLVGRVLRAAAAGTFVVSSLANSNHPVLRLARVGPLLYLLRSGL